MTLNAWALGATPVLETNGNATLNGHPDSATSWHGLHDQTPRNPSTIQPDRDLWEQPGTRRP